MIYSTYIALGKTSKKSCRANTIVTSGNKIVRKIYFICNLELTCVKMTALFKCLVNYFGKTPLFTPLTLDTWRDEHKMWFILSKGIWSKCQIKFSMNHERFYCLSVNYGFCRYRVYINGLLWKFQRKLPL